MAASNVILTVDANTSALDARLQSSFAKGDKLAANLGSSLGRSGLGQIGKDFDAFDRSLISSNARVLAFGVSAGIILNVVKGFRSMVQQTVEVDAALKNVNVILQLSNRNFQTFSSTLFDIAKQTGTPFKNIAEGSISLARAGLGATETLKRLKDAAILARLSGLDLNESVETITSSINSFSKSLLDSTNLVSKFAAVDAAFSVSSKDLAESIKRVGSASEDVGVDINSLIGLISSARQQSGREGPVISQALNSVFSRVGRPEVIEDLRSLGVEISNSQNGIQKLQALSRALETASADQAALIRFNAGGVRNLNILSTLLKDVNNEYGIYARATRTAASATNEAQLRNEELNKSFSTLINKTGVNLVQFSSQLGNLTIGPALEKSLGAVNTILEGAFSKNPESLGQVLGSGLLKGLSEALSGPGLALIAITIGKLVRNLAIEAGGGLKSILGLNEAAKQRAGIEFAVTNALKGQPELIALANSGYNGQLQVIQKINAGIAETIALNTAARNVSSVYISTAGRVPTSAKQIVPHFADTSVIPNFANPKDKFLSFLSSVNPSYVKSFRGIQNQDTGLASFIRNSADLRGAKSQSDMGSMLKKSLLQYTPSKYGLETTSYFNLDKSPQELREQIGGLFGKFGKDVPNFSPLTAAINREKASGVSFSQIKVGKSPHIASINNPLGLGVYNTRDEPGGLSQGISRALREGRNPKNYNVPNFAPFKPLDPSTFDVGIAGSGLKNIVGEQYLKLAASVRLGEINARDATKQFELFARGIGALPKNIDKINNSFQGIQDTFRNLEKNKLLTNIQAVQKTGGIYPSPSQDTRQFAANVGGLKNVLAPQFAQLLKESQTADRIKAEQASDARRYQETLFKNAPPTIEGPIISERERRRLFLIQKRKEDQGKLKLASVHYADPGDLPPPAGSPISNIPFSPLRTPRGIYYELDKLGGAFERSLSHGAYGRYYANGVPPPLRMAANQIRYGNDINPNSFGRTAPGFNTPQQVFNQIQQRQAIISALAKQQTIQDRYDRIYGLGNRINRRFDSGYNQANSFLQRSGFQNAALAGSFLIPTLAGGAAEAFNKNTLGGRGAAQSIQSGANILSYGLLSSQFGGVTGGAIGLGVGALLEVPRIITAFTDKIPDLEREIERLTERVNQANDGFGSIIQTNEKLAAFQKGELNLTPTQYGRLKTGQSNQISQLANIFPELAVEIRKAAFSGNVEQINKIGGKVVDIESAKKLSEEIALLKEKLSPSSNIGRAFNVFPYNKDILKSFNSTILNTPNVKTQQSLGNFFIEGYQKNSANNRLLDLQKALEKASEPTPRDPKLERETLIQNQRELGVRFGALQRLGFNQFGNQQQLVSEATRSVQIQQIAQDLLKQLDVASLIESSRIPTPDEKAGRIDFSELIKSFFNLRRELDLFTGRLSIITESDLAKVQRTLELNLSNVQTKTNIRSGRTQPFSPFGAIDIQTAGDIQADRLNTESKISSLNIRQRDTDRGLPVSIFSNLQNIARKRAGKTDITYGQTLNRYQNELSGSLENILPNYKAFQYKFEGGAFIREDNDPQEAIKNFIDKAKPEDIEKFYENISKQRNELFKKLSDATGNDKETLNDILDIYEETLNKRTLSKETTASNISNLIQSSLNNLEISNNKAIEAKQSFINGILQQDADIIENVNEYAANLNKIYEKYNLKNPNFKNIRGAQLETSLNKLQTARNRYNAGDLGARDLQPLVSDSANKQLLNDGSVSQKSLGDIFKSSFGYNSRDLGKDLISDMEGIRDALTSIRPAARDAFASMVDGSKSAGDAFRQFGVNIATNVLNNVSKLAFDNLFGNLFNSQTFSSIGNLFSSSGKSRGGLIGFAGGGMVSGGSGIRDDVPAMLANGAYVIKKSSVNKYGSGFLSSLNSGRGFASGGINQILRNEYNVTGSKLNARGAFNVDSRLSVIGQTDENNPANALKFGKEQDYYGYLNTIKNYKKAVKQFEAAKTQRLIGAYVSGAINIGSYGISSYKSNSGNRAAITNGVDYNGFQNTYGNFAALGGLSTLSGIKRYANGGRTDSIPALLTSGEFVMSPQTVNRMGVGFMNRLNGGQISPRGYATGGFVGRDINAASPVSQNNSNDWQQINASLLRLIKISEENRDLNSGAKPQVDKNADNKNTDNALSAPQVNITINMSGDKVNSTQNQSNNTDNNNNNGQDLKKFAELMKNVALETIVQQQRPNGLLSNSVRK